MRGPLWALVGIGGGGALNGARGKWKAEDAERDVIQ